MSYAFREMLHTGTSKNVIKIVIVAIGHDTIFCAMVKLVETK